MSRSRASASDRDAMLDVFERQQRQIEEIPRATGRVKNTEGAQPLNKEV
jgi:hypothetical protein